MPNAGTNRRGFLSLCTKALTAVIGLMVAVPALGYFFAPLRRKHGAVTAGSAFMDMGALADYPAGEWCLRVLEMAHEDGWKKTRVRHAVWVRRRQDNESAIDVLSSICPHLGCPVNWHPEQAHFVCPCHGGIFQIDGRPIAGPAPRSMDPLDFEVRAGRLWVRWQDFKIGVAERVPVSA